MSMLSNDYVDNAARRRGWRSRPSSSAEEVMSLKLDLERSQRIMNLKGTENYIGWRELILNELSKKGLKEIVLNERNELAKLEETDFTDSEDDFMMLRFVPEQELSVLDTTGNVDVDLQIELENIKINSML